ncbi:MAG: hypothetical protein MZU97_21215 [Bacillus subtilis]|nr:hypothetical protein [Bacillus subtilis]
MYATVIERVGARNDFERRIASSNECISSTTTHNSTPCSGEGPLTCSSEENKSSALP